VPKGTEGNQEDLQNFWSLVRVKLGTSFTEQTCIVCTKMSKELYARKLKILVPKLVVSSSCTPYKEIALKCTDCHCLRIGVYNGQILNKA
jgi:hypothetical protein